MTPPEPTTDDIQALSDKVTPVVRLLLAGHHPVAQGAVLADLVATWLAGHCYTNDNGDGDLAETRTLRAQLFTEFIETVDRLLPVCAHELGTPHDPVIFPDADYEQRH